MLGIDIRRMSALLFAGLCVASLSATSGVARAAPAAAPISFHDGCGWSKARAVEPVVVRRRSMRKFLARPAPPLPDRSGRQDYNVTLQAALAPNAPPLDEGLSWQVLKLGPAPQERELVWSGGGAEPHITLKPGRYYAEVTYGLTENGAEIEVAAGKPVSKLISLEAGTLLVHAAPVAGGAALSDVFFTLRKAGENGKQAEIGRSSLPQAVFHVPAGNYQLTAKYGMAKVELPVSVAAGEAKPVEAVMNTGVLTLSARAKADSPALSGVTYFVFQHGEAGSPREIIRSKLDEPMFSLSAGQYRVAAVLGLARVEENVTVRAGEQQSRNLILNAGGVRLASTLTGNGKRIEDHILYRVYSLKAEKDAANQELLTSTLASPTLFLPAGPYRFESQYGWHNARQSKDVEVKAGEVLDVNFEHKASDVRLRLVDKPGGEAVNKVKWTLKYNGGGTVLISQDAEPTLILQAGSYQAMAQHDAKTYTQTFEAASNQEQTVEIVAQ
jgi:hypothetical protein